MSEINTELPSTVTLIKSTVIAVVLAAVILVTIVLPAEYGIDPTGIGGVMGLVEMGEIKVSLAKEVAEAEEIATQQAGPVQRGNNLSPKAAVVAENITTEPTGNVNSDEVKITLNPNEGKELKFAMDKGKQVNYVWFTDGKKVFFDSHADSETIKYHKYGKGSVARSDGVMEAVFDGKHGWFWRNRTAEVMQITLQLNGEYSDIQFVN